MPEMYLVQITPTSGVLQAADSPNDAATRVGALAEVP